MYLGIYEDHDRVIPVAVKLLQLGGDAEQQAWVQQTWQHAPRLVKPGNIQVETDVQGTGYPIGSPSIWSRTGIATLWARREARMPATIQLRRGPKF